MAGNIIVGVTGASVSRRAVDWAIERATRRRQSIELISVVGGAIGAIGEAEVLGAAQTATQQLLDGEAKRVADAGVPVSTRVESGNPVTKLVEASAGAAVLVIGSDYRGTGSGPARGVHGIRIAAGATCPVVVVPDRDLGEGMGVVVGVDGSDVTEHAIEFAASEADRLGEPLIAVSVWTPVNTPRNAMEVYPDLYLANMQSMTEEVLALSLAGLSSRYPDLRIVRRVERGHPSQVLTAIAADARMVVVGTHGRRALARFLLGSISQELLSHLPTVTAVVR
ncbi:universal stress protein [Microbacterium oleivorans]|uniref:UspA domain-containing protein n=1 Tax=Microbacterium oleivorans TaxID=273677 RepID=A0A031FXT2_9MICO|nr:universal stress protein [Microbacterium oleivorans]AZS44880.1 Universal stress protein [Microbacterium oleivorans]EZP29016.1 UspA domain-containing protein [Microbacterium oleivorans]THE08413.1 universal stress protein [Microbacterium oleivorans]